MKEKRSIKSLILAIALVLIISSLPAFALTEDFSAGGKKEVYASKCSSAENEITIFNTGDITSSYTINLEGKAAEWSAAAPLSFELKPGKGRNVFNHIKVPCNVPKGEYNLDTIITTKLGNAKRLSQKVIVGKMSNLAITPIYYSDEIGPCETAVFKFRVTNTGDFPETYEFSADTEEALGGQAVFAPSAAIIPAGESKTITFRVTPDCAIYGDYEFSVNTYARTNSLGAETSGFALKINQEYGFNAFPGKPYTPEEGVLPEFEQASGSYTICENRNLHVPVMIENAAEVRNVFWLELEQEGKDDEWISINGNRIELAPGQKGIATISILPPKGTEKAVDLAFTIKTEIGDMMQEIPVHAEIQNCRVPEIAEGIRKIKAVYEASSVKAGITNTGNKQTAYQISVEGAGWITAEPSRVFVNPGETGEFLIELNPTAETEEGTHNIIVKAAVEETGDSYEKNLKVKIKEPRLSNMIFDEYLPYTIGVIALLALMMALFVVALVKLEKTKDQRAYLAEERRKEKEEMRAEKEAKREAWSTQRESYKSALLSEKDELRRLKEEEKEKRRKEKEALREEKRRLKEERKAEKLKLKEERRAEKAKLREQRAKEKEEKRKQKEKDREQRRKDKEEARKKREEEKKKAKEDRIKEHEREQKEREQEIREFDQEREERIRIKAEKRANFKKNIGAWKPFIIFITAIILLAVAGILIYAFALEFFTAHIAEIILIVSILVLIVGVIWAYERISAIRCKIFKHEGIVKKVSGNTGWRKGLGEVIAKLKIPVANPGLVIRSGGKSKAFLKPEGSKVYQYFEALKKNFDDSDISDAVMRFRVSRGWLKRKNVKESSIKLLRFGNGKWEPVKSKQVDSDSRHVYYEAETKQFSLFAIAGKPEPAPIKPKVRTRTIIKIKEVIKKVPVTKIKRIIKEVPVIKIRKVPVVKIKEIIKKIPVVEKIKVPIEKIVYRDRKIKVPVEKIVYKTKEVKVPVEKIVYKYRDRKIKVPVEKIVYKDREVKAPRVKSSAKRPVKKAKQTEGRDSWVWIVFGLFIIALLVIGGIFVYQNYIAGSFTGIGNETDTGITSGTVIDPGQTDEPDEPQEPADEPQDVINDTAAAQPIANDTASDEPAVNDTIDTSADEPADNETDAGAADEPQEPEEPQEPADEPQDEEPEFAEPEWGIQKQEWDIDEAYMLDLNQYFKDPDGDVLTFSHTPLEHITVTVSDGIAEFVPEAGWSGTEHVKFMADDGKGGLIESNEFRLVVKERPELNISVLDSVKGNISKYSNYIMIGVLILIILILLMEFRKPLMKFLEE